MQGGEPFAFGVGEVGNHRLAVDHRTVLHQRTAFLRRLGHGRQQDRGALEHQTFGTVDRGVDDRAVEQLPGSANNMKSVMGQPQSLMQAFQRPFDVRAVSNREIDMLPFGPRQPFPGVAIEETGRGRSPPHIGGASESGDHLHQRRPETTTSLQLVAELRWHALAVVIQ